MPVTITNDSPMVEVAQSIFITDAVSSEQRVAVIGLETGAITVLWNEFIVEAVSDGMTVEVTGPSNGELPSYVGSYEVIPTLEGTTLPTANRTTRRDIDVRPIPTSKVSNPQGGYTFMIG